jgi:hypothetical protein
MKLVLFKYECLAEGVFFKAPQISPHAYGEFLLRKKNSPSLRYLNAIASSAYEYVAHELEISPEVSGLDEVMQSNVLQAIFGNVACDPDVDGKPFEMGLLPYCNNCKDPSCLSWQITDPIEFVEIEVPPVTFLVWDRLSDEEKKFRIMQNLRSVLRTAIVA